MKRQILTFATVCTAATFIMGTCKKDDAPQPAEGSIIGTWKITSYVSDRELTNGDGTKFTDFVSQMYACTQDNLFIYKDGGVLEYDEGPTKCHPTDQQTKTYGWSKNGNTLSLSTGVTATILQLDATTLKYSAPGYFRYTKDQGATYDSTYCVVTITHARQ